MTIEQADDALTIVDTFHDLADAFSLSFLAVVVVSFAGGIGGKLFDVPGFVGGLALTSPLWGWLVVGALKRVVNTTRITVTKGTISVRVGPIGRKGSRELTGKDVTVSVKGFENRSSTRGGKLLIVKTYSIWANDLCLLEPFDTEPEAKDVEKKIVAAFKGR